MVPRLLDREMRVGDILLSPNCAEVYFVSTVDVLSADSVPPLRAYGVLFKLFPKGPAYFNMVNTKLSVTFWNLKLLKEDATLEEAERVFEAVQFARRVDGNPAVAEGGQ